MPCYFACKGSKKHISLVKEIFRKVLAFFYKLSLCLRAKSLGFPSLLFPVHVGLHSSFVASDRLPYILL